jgi:hypothetical protein
LLPVACTLGAIDGAQRVEEWRRLSTAAGLGRGVAGGKLTLRFRDVDGVGEELDRLVSSERECCAFLGWELVHSGAEWHVHITGSPDELRALAFAATGG